MVKGVGYLLAIPNLGHKIADAAYNAIYGPNKIGEIGGAGGIAGHFAALTGQGGGFGGLGGSGAESGLGLGSDTVSKVEGDLHTIGQSYIDAVRKIREKLTEAQAAHIDKMNTIKESIGTTQKKIKDLANTYKQSIADINNSRIDEAANEIQKVADLTQKLEDLKLRAYQEDKRGSVSLQTNNEIERARKQLEQEKAALDAYLAAHPDQAAAATKEAGLTDFERKQNDLAQQENAENSTIQRPER